MNLLEVDPEKLCRVLGCSEELGLSSEQAQTNFREFGANTYTGRAKKPFGVFKRIFSDLILLLFVAMGLYAVSTQPDEEILCALLYTLFGYLLFVVGGSLYVERTLARVRTHTAVRCRVKRDGKIISVESERLVPGDTLYLERGEVIPCDGIILRKRSLKVLEAGVTGKCEAVIKREYRDVAEGDLPYFDCILFAGTVILAGHATVLVCNTGKNIFDGGNSNVKRARGEMPRFHDQVKFVSKQLSLVWIPASFLVFALGVMGQRPLFEMFYYAMALMVAAMPDGLRLLGELCVALQVSSLMKKGCVLKNYAAIDKLSSVNCVTVHSEDFFLGQYPVVGTYLTDNCPYPYKEQPRYARQLIELALVCNCDPKKSLKVDGRSIDAAVELAARDFGLKLKKSRKAMGAMSWSDHDPRRGFSSVFGMKEGRYRGVIRGTPESVLRRCTRMKKGDEVVFLNESAKLRLLDTARSWVANGEFVLALALWDSSSPPEGDPAEDWNGMVFMGFLGFYTPLRTNAAQAASHCEKNGVDVLLMASSDPHRSYGLAKRLSLVEEGQERYALDDASYQSLDRGLFLADLTKYKVFCALDPGQQQEIVAYRKENGDVTAALSDSLASSIAQSEADVSFVYGGAEAPCVRHNADVLLKNRSFEGVYQTLKSVQAICTNDLSMLSYGLFVQFAILLFALLPLICFGQPLFSPSVLIAFGLCVGICGGLATVGRPSAEIGLKRSSERNFAWKHLLLPFCAGALTALGACLSYRVVDYYTSLRELACSAALISVFFAGVGVRFFLIHSSGGLRRLWSSWDWLAIVPALLAVLGLVLVRPAAAENFDAIPDLVTVIIALVIGCFCVGMLWLLQRLLPKEQTERGN